MDTPQIAQQSQQGAWTGECKSSGPLLHSLATEATSISAIQNYISHRRNALIRRSTAVINLSSHVTSSGSWTVSWWYLGLMLCGWGSSIAEVCSLASMRGVPCNGTRGSPLLPLSILPLLDSRRDDESVGVVNDTDVDIAAGEKTKFLHVSTKS